MFIDTKISNLGEKTSAKNDHVKRWAGHSCVADKPPTIKKKKWFAEWAKMPNTHVDAHVKHRTAKMYGSSVVDSFRFLPIQTRKITDTVHSLDCLALFVSISCCRQRRAMRTIGFAVGVGYMCSFDFPFSFSEYLSIAQSLPHSFFHGNSIHFATTIPIHEQIYIFFLFVVVVRSYGACLQFLCRRRQWALLI